MFYYYVALVTAIGVLFCVLAYTVYEQYHLRYYNKFNVLSERIVYDMTQRKENEKCFIAGLTRRIRRKYTICAIGFFICLVASVVCLNVTEHTDTSDIVCFGSPYTYVSRDKVFLESAMTRGNKANSVALVDANADKFINKNHIYSMSNGDIITVSYTDLNDLEDASFILKPVHLTNVHVNKFIVKFTNEVSTITLKRETHSMQSLGVVLSKAKVYYVLIPSKQD